MNAIPGLELRPAAPERVTARAYEDGGQITLQLEGMAEAPDGDGLMDFLRRVHAKAMLLGAQMVVVDVQQLRFMASACFKGFVSWVSVVQDLEDRYRIRFRINPSIRWQNGSIRALVSFGMGTVSIEQGVAR